ncbi:unnamed protein product [Durusdinium trenchii]|uniref:Uncharacterized protein n=2 Tax=Durusdinium trenchii TaxID=1381693 RepID=A0ABP0JXJ4_9DINO
MADAPRLPAELQPLWAIVSQECSASCLAMLEPHLSMFVQVADLANQQGLPRLRAFLKCIGGATVASPSLRSATALPGGVTVASPSLPSAALLAALACLCWCALAAQN